MDRIGLDSTIHNDRARTVDPDSSTARIVCTAGSRIEGLVRTVVCLGEIAAGTAVRPQRGANRVNVHIVALQGSVKGGSRPEREGPAHRNRQVVSRRTRRIERMRPFAVADHRIARHREVRERGSNDIRVVDGERDRARIAGCLRPGGDRVGKAIRSRIPNEV